MSELRTIVAENFTKTLHSSQINNQFQCNFFDGDAGDYTQQNQNPSSAAKDWSKREKNTLNTFPCCFPVLPRRSTVASSSTVNGCPLFTSWIHPGFDPNFAPLKKKGNLKNNHSSGCHQRSGSLRSHTKTNISFWLFEGQFSLNISLHCFFSGLMELCGRGQRVSILSG